MGDETFQHYILFWLSFESGSGLCCSQDKNNDFRKNLLKVDQSRPSHLTIQARFLKGNFIHY